MARVGFILKANSDEANQLLGSLSPWLVESGHAPVFLAEDGTPRTDGKVVSEEELCRHIDLAVVLGGDGTMLRGAALLADAGIPILGVNLGRLGFLTPFDPKEAESALSAALAGNLGKSERMRMAVTHRPLHGPVETRAALNDAIVHQGAMARLVELSAEVDGAFVANYRADGLIVATPTGSTAYNLAAGGPIIWPRHQAMVITPICSHALTNRPLVVDAERVVSLTAAPSSGGVVITIDGLWARPVEPGDRVEIRANARPLVIFESDKPYFDILREKLHWGRALVEPAPAKPTR